MKTIPARLALVIFGLLIAIGGAEFTVRLTQIGSDQMHSQDRELGLRFIESKSGLNQGSGLKARVTSNSHGWRRPETTWDKPDDVYRILVLGDTLMAAVQVNDDETSSAVMEALLNRENLSKQVEVINLGVPTFGTDQEYLVLRDFATNEGIDFPSLVPTFLTKIGEGAGAFDSHYLPCDGHWSTAGNRLAAGTLAAYLEPIIEKSLTS